MNHPTPTPASFRNARRAFTLLEILVVLAIIGMLVGLAVNNIGKALDNARIDSTKIFVRTSLKTPLALYKNDNGDYPSTTDGLQALLTAPAGATNWRGPYLDVTPAGVMPKDAWQQDYRYAYPGTHSAGATATQSLGGTNPTATVITTPDVWSIGPDHIDGTEDDIGNW